MEVKNISQAKEWFQVLQTGNKRQTAMMTLAPGESSGDKAAHECSEQILLLLEGELAGEIGNEKTIQKKGDVILISVGVTHRFTNRSGRPDITFNIYSPPEYSADARN